MTRVAVFVDAGYLFAQGSTALAGSKQARSLLKINETAAVAELSGVVTARCSAAALLRVYWYDGITLYKGMSAEQARVAEAENIKIRFGFLNSVGQQKGVDSLIVTDLIDLARNGAICDAVLLSGDEDVRIGVQVAQSYGVRVHLIGIFPSRGSQSRQLRQEADTLTEWDRVTVAKFLTVNPRQSTTPNPVAVAAPSAKPVAGTAALVQPSATSKLDAVVSAMVGTLTADDVAGIRAFWGNQRGIPLEFDGKILARGRVELGRDLDTAEKRHCRSKFVALVKAIP